MTHPAQSPWQVKIIGVNGKVRYTTVTSSKTAEQAQAYLDRKIAPGESYEYWKQGGRPLLAATETQKVDRILRHCEALGVDPKTIHRHHVAKVLKSLAASRGVLVSLVMDEFEDHQLSLSSHRLRTGEYVKDVFEAMKERGYL